MRSAMGLVIVFVSFLCASCLSVAGAMYNPEYTEETSDLESQVRGELKDVDARIAEKEYEDVCSSWIGRSEKDLLLAWGSPSFAKDIDENHSFYIYQFEESTTSTSGGTLSAHTDALTGKTDYYSKSDETTIVSSSMIGRFTFELGNGVVKDLKVDGSKPEKLIKKPSDMVYSDEYEELQARKKVILEKQEVVYSREHEELLRYDEEHPVTRFIHEDLSDSAIVIDSVLLGLAVCVPLFIAAR